MHMDWLKTHSDIESNDLIHKIAEKAANDENIIPDFTKVATTYRKVNIIMDKIYKCYYRLDTITLCSLYPHIPQITGRNYRAIKLSNYTLTQFLSEH